jgi:ABC-type transporter Mla subunit MlaD
MNERHTGSNRARWIAFLLVGAAIAVGVVLLVLYGGGTSSGPY